MGADVVREEAWRCIFTFGMMVEIGNLNVPERDSISLGSLSRNASFREIYMHHSYIPDSKSCRSLLNSSTMITLLISAYSEFPPAETLLRRPST